MNYMRLLLVSLLLVLATVGYSQDIPEDAFAFSGNNTDWTPIERVFDGITMVLVPAGCFTMGIETEGNIAEQAHEVCIERPFWIDKTEVTQRDFTRLGGIKTEPNVFEGEERPVDSISWFEAQMFCQQRGGRLPTEAEWEFAARGPEGWRYPWGDNWDAEKLFAGENKDAWNWWAYQGTVTVGSILQGASWVGALDMSGNVWEWTSSLLAPYPYEANDGREADTGGRIDVFRVLRGGSWFELRPEVFSGAFREWHRPDHTDMSYGFRCVRDIETAG